MICDVDDVGIVHGFSKILSDYGGTISESRWATFGGDFVAFLNVSFAKVVDVDEDERNSAKMIKIRDIKEKLKFKFPNMSISVHSATEKTHTDEYRKYYRVHASGPDVVGLIRDFSNSFESSGISVVDMSTVRLKL